jgi:hypothetical protein
MVKAIFNKIYGKMLKILLHMGKLGADSGTLEGTVWSTPSRLHWAVGSFVAAVGSRVSVAVAPLPAAIGHRKPMLSASWPSQTRSRMQSFYYMLQEVVGLSRTFFLNFKRDKPMPNLLNGNSHVERGA